MVYGNYDPAYIQPNCDLCGDTLEKRHQYTPIEIETAFNDTGVRTAQHDGHLCNSCNELSEDDVIGNAEKLKFHLEGRDPVRLLLVEVLGPHGAQGELRPQHKYGPEEAPEFLQQLAYGITSCSAGIRGLAYTDDTVEEIGSKYEEVASEV